MDSVIELTKVDFKTVFLGVLITLFAFTTIYETIRKIYNIWKKPADKYKQLEEDRMRIVENKKAIKELSEKHEYDMLISNENDKLIRKELEHLTNIVIDKEISDIRWELLNFSSALSNGRLYNREAFNHIFSLYEKYEKILAENKMKNGLVDESMEYAKEQYHELLKSGKLK